MAQTQWSPLSEWIEKLDDVTQEGHNYRAVCPKHGGHGLLLSEDRNTKRVFFDCKAGCEYSEVAEKLRELGIRLWADNLEFHYFNADGTLAFIKVKYRRKSDGQKAHFYKCPGTNGVPANHNSESKGTRGADGKCKRCGVGRPSMLYRLPELLAGIERGAEVWLCEGEKDAEAVVEMCGARDIVATTTMNGVDDWNAEYRDTLAQASTIVIVAHNDEKLALGTNPGFQGAWKRYVSLSEFAPVRVVRAAEGNDAFDHRANGHGIDDFVELSPEELAKHANPDTPTSSLGSGVFLYTQSEYADRFVSLYGERFRYITLEDCWLYYDEGRWREDQYDAAFHFAEKLCRQILDETPERSPDGKKVNHDWDVAKQRCGAGNIASVVRIARTRRPIVTVREKFDTNPMLINVVNGTYDLQARLLREHRQDDMITKMCPFRYDPQATGPHFDDYFKEVQPNGHWREQILRNLGYSISGKFGEFVFIHVGSGGNGKTTLLKLASRVIGNYGATASWKILSNRGEESHETILAELEGKRFAVVQMGGRALSSEQLRTIVAEPDFKARKMREDSRTIESVHTLHVAQNDPPPMKQLDASTRRRVIVVEWNTKIEDPDDDLPIRLFAEGDYVLTQIIDAFARWSNHGMDRSATEQFFKRNRTYAWVAEFLEPDPTAWIYSSELTARCDEWRKEVGDPKPITETELGITMSGLGSKKERKDLGEGRHMARSGFRFRPVI